MVVNAEAPNTPAEDVASASAANQLYGATLSQRLTHQVSHLLKEGNVIKANIEKKDKAMLVGNHKRSLCMKTVVALSYEY